MYRYLCMFFFKVFSFQLYMVGTKLDSPYRGGNKIPFSLQRWAYYSLLFTEMGIVFAYPDKVHLRDVNVKRL